MQIFPFIRDLKKRKKRERDFLDIKLLNKERVRKAYKHFNSNVRAIVNEKETNKCYFLRVKSKDDFF